MAAQGLTVIPITSSTSPQSFRKPIEQILCFSQLNSFKGSKLVMIQPSSFGLLAARRRSFTVATVSFSLPTSKVEGAVADNKPTWSARAIKSFAMGELEARKLKYPTTGTEAMVMGILVEGTSLASKFLRENGITLFKVREQIVELLGKSDMYFFSPEHPPMTEPAQRALDWALAEKLKSGVSGEVTTIHLLLGVWSEKESAGYKILAANGLTDEKVNELAKKMDKDVEFSFR